MQIYIYGAVLPSRFHFRSWQVHVMSKPALDGRFQPRGKMGGSGPVVAEVATMRIQDAFQGRSENAETGSTARGVVVRQSRLCDVARSLAIRRWMFENI
jgi:hypothetical protein